ncbi:MAG: hypothetical protein HFF42_00135 [Lawsonibacter sp.]|jgi:hypothetical protein|nr:hypothetical protein [Lawsonibacter sp.]
MAYICITYTGVSAANQLLQKAIREMEEVDEASLKVETQIDSEVSSYYQIAERLQNYHRSAESIHQTMKELLEATNSGLMEYRTTERRLNQAAQKTERLKWGE